MWQYIYSDELYHYGIKGMKWGVRRYQNEDGTLTAAGKKRNSSNSKSSDTDKEKRERAKKDVAKYGEKLKKGTVYSIIALAMETTGNHSMAKVMDAKANKTYSEWQKRYNEALAIVKDTKVSELKK